MNGRNTGAVVDLKRENSIPTGENTSAEYLGILKNDGHGDHLRMANFYQLTTQRAACQDGPPRFLSHFPLRFDRGYDTMQKNHSGAVLCREGAFMKKTPKPRDTVQRLKETIHKQPAVFAVYVALRLIVLAELVMSIIRGEYESAFICLLVLALFILPFFIQQNFGIQLPSVLEIIILLFIFAAEILGELECYFITYPNWDSMLHTTTGFLCAATGFALIDILNRNSRIKFQLSPVYVALAAFCFSMTVGVLWEFFEFGMDRVFHLDMQKDTVVQSITSVMLDPTNSNTPITIDGIHSVAVNGTDLGFDGYLDIGLYDTMEDLFVNFIGAVTFSVIGYFYIKHRGKGKLAQAFIPTLSEDEEASLPEGDPGAPPESE